MIKYHKDSDNIVTLTIHRDDMPMNALDKKFLILLEQRVEQALEEKCTGIIITSSKKEFMAGADISMIASMNSIKECRRVVAFLHQVFRKIEKCNIPVVTAINGTALGAGYELALTTHYRISINNPKIQIGLPEVSLGVLPGGGGTQRLPRMIGFQQALPLMVEGKKVNPEKAKDMGMIDELSKDEKDLMKKAKQWIQSGPNIVKAWDERKFKLPGGEVQSPQGYQFFSAATAMVKEKTSGNYPAAEAILQAVYEGLQVPIDQALDIESGYFAKLVTSKVSKNMIRTLFMGVNACKKGVGRPKDIPETTIKQVAVLGAGMMGAGIAYEAARAGIKVILKDIKKDIAEKGKNYSEKLLVKGVERGKITEKDKKDILARILPTDKPEMVKGSDLVIEAVIEDRKIKAEVTKESEEVLDGDAVFSSNTSTLPITGLAKESKRPENFIGIHFFSPVEKMPLVEIIMGEKTSDQALARSIDFVKQIRKTPIVVNDGRGFYTSRVFTTYIEEGIQCLNDGFSPAIIENVSKMAGMPVGPLSVADEISIDLVYHVLSQTKKDLGDLAVSKSFDDTITLFVKELGRLGRKTKKGFYEYPEGEKKYLWPDLKKHFPIDPDKDDADEVRTRILNRQVLESVRCLEEGILRSTIGGDVGSIFGWGFPPYTGGTISYVDFIGLPTFITECEILQKKHGDRFKVPKMLYDMLKDGRSFYNNKDK